MKQRLAFLWQSVLGWAQRIRRDVVALYFAARDPRVPWFAKGVAAFVAAYALSPIDLIPDFIPVLGYLDDVILVPLGIIWAVRLIPPDVMAALRQTAAAYLACPDSRYGAVVILAIWFVALIFAARWVFLSADRLH